MFLALAFVVAGFAAVPAPAGAHKSMPRLLFVSSYSPGFLSFPAQHAGLIAGLAANGFPAGDYVLDTEFLDSKRFPYALRARHLRRDLEFKLATLPAYDLIVTADDNALRFALDNAGGLFRGAPIVFLGINDIPLAHAQNANPRVTGVIEQQSYGETAALAARLFPGGALHVTHGYTTTGHINNRYLEDALARVPGLKVDRYDLATITYDEFFARMATVPATEPFLINAIYRDATGASLDFGTFMTRLRAVYAGPVFIGQAHAVGAGVLGGKVVSHEEQGRAAAAMVARILTGTPVAAIPVADESPNVYMFDDRELKRLRIADSRLPPGSIIRNRPVSVLVEYIEWIAGGTAVLLLQTALIVVLVHNRHRRRRAETAMRESEARLDAFFNHSSEIMYVKSREHRVIAANRRYTEFYGVAAEDIIGSRSGGLPEDKRAEVEAQDDAILETGEPMMATMEIDGGNGPRHFRVAKFPIVGPAGDIIAIGGINTDLTEMKDRKTKLEAAKLDAERAALEAQAANRTKSEFLANMSHEIRTPMNGILGAVNVLAASELSPRQRENVETVRESGVVLLDLLNDILDLSKIEAGKMDLEETDYSVAALLRSTETLWASPARQKGLYFRIVNNIETADIVRSDRTRLGQVLHNLIGNALKFTAEGGIEVHAAEIPRDDGRVELRFEVRDTGIGIDEETQARLFSPFTQADQSTTRHFGGTGLGLSISRRIVELAGGEIGLESRLGQGSVFRFSIVAERGDPAAVSRGRSASAAVSAGAGAAARDIRILLAEDNEINRRIVVWMLEPLGCRLDVVEDGLQAVAAVARSNYDIVLMDVQMPEMDGITATARIRALPAPARDVPIVALTANAMRGDRERYLAAGMTDYVAKPIDPRELMSVICRRLGLDPSASPPVSAAGPAAPPDATAEGTAPDATAILDELDRLLEAG